MHCSGCHKVEQQADTVAEREDALRPSAAWPSCATCVNAWSLSPTCLGCIYVETPANSMHSGPRRADHKHITMPGASFVSGISVQRLIRECCGGLVGYMRVARGAFFRSGGVAMAANRCGTTNDLGLVLSCLLFLLLFPALIRYFLNIGGLSNDCWLCLALRFSGVTDNSWFCLAVRFLVCWFRLVG